MQFNLISEALKNVRIELVPTTPTPGAFTLDDNNTGAIGVDPVTGALQVCLAGNTFVCTPGDMFVPDNHLITWPAEGCYIGVSVNGGPVMTCRALTSWRPVGQRKSFDALIEVLGQEDNILVGDTLYDNFEFSGIDDMGNEDGRPFGFTGIPSDGPIKRETTMTFHNITAPGLNLYTECGMTGQETVMTSCGKAFMAGQYFLVSPSPQGTMMILHEQFSYRVDAIGPDGKQTLIKETKVSTENINERVRRVAFSKTGDIVIKTRDDWEGNPEADAGKWGFKLFGPSDTAGPLWFDGTEKELDLDHDGATIRGVASHAFSSDDQYLAIISWQDSGDIHIYERQNGGGYKRVSTKSQPQGLAWRDVGFGPDGTFIVISNGRVNDSITPEHFAYDFANGVIGTQWTQTGQWLDTGTNSSPANYIASDYTFVNDTTMFFMRTWGYQLVEFDKGSKTINGVNLTQYPIYPEDDDLSKNKNVSYNNLALLDDGKTLITIWDKYNGDSAPRPNTNGFAIAKYNPGTKKLTVPAVERLEDYIVDKPTGDQNGLYPHPTDPNLLVSIAKMGPWYTQWWKWDGTKLVEQYPNGGEPVPI